MSAGAGAGRQSATGSADARFRSAEIVHKLRHPPPLIRPSVSMGAAPPDAVAVMRQCWSEQPDLRPDFSRLRDLFRHMHRGR